MAAASNRYRQSVRRRNPGHRPNCQSHAEKMPRVQDAIPGNPQRAWQRRANPVLINPLHLAPESTHHHNRPITGEATIVDQSDKANPALSWNWDKLFVIDRPARILKLRFHPDTG